MSQERYQLPVAQALTQAYIEGNREVVEGLYGYHAGSLQDWEKRFAWLQGSTNTRATSAEVASVLREYNERHGATQASMRNIAALAEGAPVVVGGQQAGLWTGPLLVIHKAVSVIGAAKSASEQLGVHVVPVFWIAGEDHDWDEANHAYVVTADQELRKLTASKPEGSRTSVSRTRIAEEQWEKLVGELEQSLPSSEFKASIMERLRQLTKSSGTLSDMFASIMAIMFGEVGLVLLDADDAALRALEAPMFRRMLEENDELSSAYSSAAEKVQSFGFPLQAEVAEDAANLFLFQGDKDDERTLLYKREGGFRDRRGTVFWSKDELLRLAGEQPQQFSNNVMTRPIMQDYLLPVLGVVLGPGEIAYWAMTGEAFRTLGMEMPIIVPRMSYTLVEGGVVKNMAKYELSFHDVMESFEEKRAAWLKGQDNLHIEARFGEARAAFETMYTPLLELAGSVQAVLIKLGETNMAKIMEQISYMESKTIEAYNKQFEASTRQLDRIRISLLPLGKPQERVVNMAVYWNRYGDDWLKKLLETPYSRTGGHEIVYL
ncbi:bacillithiol biosynthesis cysteine-adding enzyme BshC [Paenibacillus sp. PAMC21692]|uniref:bacillithiol biosynthesis cysteine-adding enzyme BshC n=1 Tax=Paenibacillus sp. PAMC21692 TaxID=2762320 RepID=UPI00164DDC61|nr:bacillithiol biosynthesis cysteine-adding enzyme BshC [Paenibacillus sp. PAMC21692]QNK54490.1 bacillithiol biosynthesis cysteine-adding enzyme BshC [Paenibacillus sp. PAMC21692]